MKEIAWKNKQKEQIVFLKQETTHLFETTTFYGFIWEK